MPEMFRTRDFRDYLDFIIITIICAILNVSKNTWVQIDFALKNDHEFSMSLFFIFHDRCGQILQSQHFVGMERK